MTEDIDLNDLVVKEGEVLDENAFTTKTSDDAENILKAIQNSEPVPGQKVEIPSADDVTLSKEKAEQDMIYKLASEKLERQRAEFNKKSDKQKIEDYLKEAQYYSNVNDFFRKHGYEMSGTQKRTLRRKINRTIEKGRYKLTEEQKQDILFEANKASRNMSNTSADAVVNSDKVIRNLDSLITTL